MRTVTLAELADEAGAPLALVERLVAIGQVRASPTAGSIRVALRPTTPG